MGLRLAFRRSLPTGAPATAADAKAAAAADRALGAEEASSCGWFDSSHDLHRGLSVCEHVDLDALPPHLSALLWLELAGRRTAPRAGFPAPTLL